MIKELTKALGMAVHIVIPAFKRLRQMVLKFTIRPIKGRKYPNRRVNGETVTFAGGISQRLL